MNDMVLLSRECDTNTYCNTICECIQSLKYRWSSVSGTWPLAYKGTKIWKGPQRVNCINLYGKNKNEEVTKSLISWIFIATYNEWYGTIVKRSSVTLILTVLRSVSVFKVLSHKSSPASGSTKGLVNLTIGIQRYWNLEGPERFNRV